MKFVGEIGGKGFASFEVGTPIYTKSNQEHSKNERTITAIMTNHRDGKKTLN